MTFNILYLLDINTEFPRCGIIVGGSKVAAAGGAVFHTNAESSEEDRARVAAADQVARTLGLTAYVYLTALAQEQEMSAGELILESVRGLVAEAEEMFKGFTAAEMAVVIDSITRPRRAKGARIHTQKAKEVYLQAMLDLCDNKLALIQAGIRSPSMPYIWARDDEEFFKRWNEARLFVGLKPFNEQPRRKAKEESEMVPNE